MIILRNKLYSTKKEDIATKAEIGAHLAGSGISGYIANSLRKDAIKYKGSRHGNLAGAGAALAAGNTIAHAYAAGKVYNKRKKSKNKN